MSDLVEIFGFKADPQVFLTALMILIAVPAAMVKSYLDYKRRRAETEAQNSSLVTFLSKPEVLEKLELSEDSVRVLVDHVRERDEAIAKRSQGETAFGKLIGGIEWDVAGLIGMLVTLFILVMSVSRLNNEIPEEVFAAWLAIIGYYFGKESKK